MKVHELIERLAAENPEAQVYLSYYYGDHELRSLVAVEVKQVEQQPLSRHALFGMLVEADEDAAETRGVVLS